MKKLLLAILCLPLIGFGQKTYVPDNAFEQVLINLDLDDIFDDSVYTAAIDTVPILYISNEGIADLTGIEDFLALTDLFCNSNQLQSLDLSNNPNLFEVNCSYNQLTSLSLKNGNPVGLWYVMAFGNPNLLCVEVDNVVYANYSWLIDPTAVFSTNCNSAIYGCTDPTALNYNPTATVDDGSCIYTTGISDIANNTRKLVKIVDMLGRETIIKNNEPLFYLYDDGTVEKKIVIE